MKRLLIAGAALALMGSAAYAQQSQPAPDSTSPAPTTAPAATPAPDTTSAAPDSTTTAPATTPAPSSDTSTAAAPSTAPATPLASGSTPTMVGDLAQSNPPPADGAYPVCKTKNQDRCTVASQAKHATMAKRKTVSKTSTGA
jgi:hypothetical protein